MALEATRWTAERLGSEERRWLESLPEGPMDLEPGLVVCHGHPEDEDTYTMGWPLVQSALAATPGALSLHGHTHVPSAFWEDPGEPEGVAGGFLLPEERQLPTGGAATANPGSVGQPRDGDPRAAYLLLDPFSRRLIWRRVAYAAASVAARVRQAGLPAWLGERLIEGR
jgi:diadenosine tetraphosphatase ApaH/serine/threonine PP2A family protein phosphatase